MPRGRPPKYFENQRTGEFAIYENEQSHPSKRRRLDQAAQSSRLALQSIDGNVQSLPRRPGRRPRSRKPTTRHQPSPDPLPSQQSIHGPTGSQEEVAQRVEVPGHQGVTERASRGDSVTSNPREPSPIPPSPQQSPHGPIGSQEQPLQRVEVLGREGETERAPRGRRPIYTEPTVVRPVGRPLKHYKVACKPEEGKKIKQHRLPPLYRQKPCPHCGALFWPAERPDPPRNNKQKWPCCSDGTVDIELPDASVDAQSTPHSSQRDDAARNIDRLIYETVDIFGDVQLTDRCKQFRKSILAYNNAMAWASEGVDTVDYRVGHYNFRMQGSVRHMIGPLIPRDGEDPKFAMIYCIDGSQDQVDARMLHNNELHRQTIHRLQSELRLCNPFASALKTSLERIQSHPKPSQTRLILKQCDPRRSERGTHNKPKASEVATVVSGLDDLNGTAAVERNIVVETAGGALQRIPYWHSCYMPLRYPLIFPYGEASWQQNTALRGTNRLPNDHLLAARNTRRQPGHLYNHNETFVPDVPPVPEEHHSEGANEEIPPQPRGRAGSRRITQRQWYRKLIQVRDILLWSIWMGVV